MSKYVYWIIPLFLIAFLMLIVGCGGEDDASGGSVLFRVTRDFGREEIFSGTIDVSPGQSALEVLQQHVDVQTEHGGRFVVAIEGLASDTRGKFQDDWFFYANGITAGVGGGDYYPREDDIIWWDYHGWGDMYFTPAVTGAFPQPFINGYRGEDPDSVLLFTPAGQESTQTMQDFLRQEGAQRVEIKPYEDHDMSNIREITMVIALWPELAGEPFWQGMVENWQRIGWFARLDVAEFIALDVTGEVEETYTSDVGAILAAGSGLGDANPIWLITALDENSLRRTVDIIVENPQYLEGTFGLFVTRQEIIRLPL